jgi:hypothetical protein
MVDIPSKELKSRYKSDRLNSTFLNSNSLTPYLLQLADIDIAMK